MIIISDLHIGALDESNLAHILQMVTDEPDLTLIICGDFTLKSKEREFDIFEQFIDDCLAAGILLVITPGNHDFGGGFQEGLSRIAGGLATKYQNCKERLHVIFSKVYMQDCVVAHRGDELDYICRIGEDVFLSLRSHHRKAARIKSDQIDWAIEVLDEMDLEGTRLHLVTHYSLWQDAGDKHEPMERLERLEAMLKTYGVLTILHGHNHRYTFQNTTTPVIHYRMNRLSSPTLSDRTRDFEKAYVRWYPSTPEILPELMDLSLLDSEESE